MSTSMQRVFLFCKFLILLYTSAFCQQSLTIKVVDSLKIPLGNCSVTWNKVNGYVTDTQGIVTIGDIASIADSIVISTIGFNKKILFPSDIIGKNFLEVILHEKVVSLPEVYVGKKKAHTIFGANDDKEGYSYIFNINSSTMQAVLFIDDYKEFRFLEEFSVFIAQKSDNKIPFRIRIYSTSDSLPAEELNKSDVIIKTYKTGGWNTFLLDSLGIIVPENGFFIGIEWLATNNHKGYKLGVGQTDSMKGYKTYIRWGNTGWRLFSLPSPRRKPTNIMYKVKLSQF